MPPVFALVLALLFAVCEISVGAEVRGTVRDATGAAVRDASVEIRSRGGDLIGSVRTGDAGEFRWTGDAPAELSVSAAAQGFSSRTVITEAVTPTVDLVLDAPESVYTRLNVTGTRTGVEDSGESAHLVIVRNEQDLASRPNPTLGHLLAESPGILVQQSTYAQVSPFLRGLTGYQVLNLIDGIRFNNSTFRSGPNQYLAFVEPSQAGRVEAFLGPTGTQFGSDSLGGTIQVLTPEMQFAEPRRREFRGDLFLGGATADWSGFGRARTSMSTERVYALLGVMGRKHNDLRAGQGHDSRNVFHRLFGMSPDAVRDLLGSRQQDTGFTQYGLQAKAGFRVRPNQLVTLYAQRGVLDHVRAYKDLLGGLGRMVSTFEPQVLNWVHGRYEKTGAGPLDSVVATVSLNQQIDGSARQNLRTTDPITTDDSRVNSYGYSGQATTHRGARSIATFGGELYDERIQSTRSVVNPASGTTTYPRALYPNHASYRTLGTFGEGSFDWTRRLRLGAGVRFTGIRFGTEADPAYGIPETANWFRDVTFHSTMRWQTLDWLGLHFVASRGFRAPNLNDLGALGLNDLGYEIPLSDVQGALLSTDAGESALSKGVGTGALQPESLMNYEAGLRINTRRLYARAQMFHADLFDPIVRRTLLFPEAGVPTQLAGLPVTRLPQTAAQRGQSVVAVATALDPRAVKAFVNDGQSRYYGTEVVAHYRLASHWSLDANYSYINGRDLFPNRPIRRLPPQFGTASVRYLPRGRRPWVELSMTAAGEQRRLSGGDRDDERIGASFRRRDIADFFSGSRVATHLSDGRFVPTGETLAQIQARVLPGVTDDNARFPLYLSTAGWATLNIRSGITVAENWTVFGALENVADRNYRVHGSGMDAAGRSAYLSLRHQF